jgi:predicted ATP-grasp superfamily ATP-dependent carboligase
LVLGDDPFGDQDVVIEVNPRVTTSYVGLRAAAESNLAAAMLALVEDRAPDLRYSPESLEFDADGTVRRAM